MAPMELAGADQDDFVMIPADDPDRDREGEAEALGGGGVPLLITGRDIFVPITQVGGAW